MTEQTKTCTKCGKEKPLEEFPNGRGRLGKRSKCITCKRMATREYRKRNLEKIKKRYSEKKHIYAVAGREYRERNKERIKEQRAAKYRANPEIAKLRVREWQKKNPEKLDEYRKRSAAKNLPKWRAAARDRYRENPGKYLKRYQEHRHDDDFLEKKRVRLNAWRKTNPVKVAASRNATYKRAMSDATRKEKYRRLKARYVKRAVDELRDAYVKSCILQKQRGSRSDVPAELITMKREQLRLARTIKQLKQEIKNVKSTRHRTRTHSST